MPKKICTISIEILYISKHGTFPRGSFSQTHLNLIAIVIPIYSPSFNKEEKEYLLQCIDIVCLQIKKAEIKRRFYPLFLRRILVRILPSNFKDLIKKYMHDPTFRVFKCAVQIHSSPES